MEVGEFTKVDSYLSEVQDTLKARDIDLNRLSEESTLFYWGKYYHLQGKNCWRELYHQRGYEIFKEGIEFLKGKQKEGGKLDRIASKYLCKLYEGLAHLLCEPLMFDWSEELLNEAESVYTNTKKHLFTDFDVMKFLLKKSAFLKKFGFFDDAIKVLDDLNT